MKKHRRPHSRARLGGLTPRHANRIDQDKVWARMFDTIGTGVAVVSPDLRIIEVNKSLAAMIGKNPEELAGLPCWRVIHGLDEPPADCLARKALAGKTAFVAQRQEAHLGGRWFQLMVDPLCDRHGRVTTLVHRFRDITEDRNRQENVETLHRLLLALSSHLAMDEVLRAALQEIAAMGYPGFAGIVVFDDFGQAIKVFLRDGSGEITEAPVFPWSVFPREMFAALMERKEPLFWNSPADVPAVIQGFVPPEALPVVNLPMVVRDKVVGVLELGKAKNTFSEGDLSFLRVCAQEIAITVDNARLYSTTDATLRERIKESEAIREVIAAASKSLDPDSILAEVTRLAAQTLGTERSAVMLRESASSMLVGRLYSTVSGFPVETGVHIELTPDHVYEHALRTLQPFVIDDLTDVQKWPRFSYARQLGIKSSLSVPLIVAGNAIGTMQYSTVTRKKTFSSGEVKLAEAIAGHVAVIIENARLHRRALEEHATLEAVIQSMEEGLILFDRNQMMVYSNRAAERLLALPPDWHKGKDLNTYSQGFLPRVENALEVMAAWEEALAHVADKPSLPLTLVIGGQRRELVIGLFPVASPLQENYRGTGALIRDVTHEKEAERMKTEFVALVSHELRTPLTSIMGFSELLLGKHVDVQDQARSLEYIVQESHRLIALLDDILNISRIEAGRLSLKLEPLSVAPVVAYVVDLFAPHSPRVAIPDTLPPVLADRQRLIEVLRNLVDNAVKYQAGAAPVSISAALSDPVTPGQDPGVVIAVKDQGVGIPQNEIPLLFTRFHRVKSPRTERVRGTGLGLYIVKVLVELMGGRVWVESKLGEGSTFYVRLPVARPQPEQSNSLNSQAV